MVTLFAKLHDKCVNMMHQKNRMQLITHKQQLGSSGN